MKISVVAVGLKMPKWADEACEDYLHRFPSDWKVELKTVKAEDRKHAHHPESDAGRSGKDSGRPAEGCHQGHHG